MWIQRLYLENIKLKKEQFMASKQNMVKKIMSQVFFSLRKSECKWSRSTDSLIEFLFLLKHCAIVLRDLTSITYTHTEIDMKICSAVNHEHTAYLHAYDTYAHTIDTIDIPGVYEHVQPVRVCVCVYLWSLPWPSANAAVFSSYSLFFSSLLSSSIVITLNRKMISQYSPPPTHTLFFCPSHCNTHTHTNPQYISDG